MATASSPSMARSPAAPAATRADFMIIGAQKSGTTSLAYQLAQHPALSISGQKEPHYFSKSKDWQAGLTRYHKLFSPRDEQLCFEASTSYSFLPEYPETAQRLRAYNPDLRLIYILRHPVERIRSHYLHRVRRGKVFRPPGAEIRRNPIYLDRSRYATQIRPYLELFPAEHILILIFEEYAADPQAAFARVAGLLGIPGEGFAAVDTAPKHVSRRHGFHGERLIGALARRIPGLGGRTGRTTLYERVIGRIEFPEALRTSLWRELEPEVAGIERILARPIDVWRRHESGRGGP